MKNKQNLAILVIDDHEGIRLTNIRELQGQYPDAKIFGAINVEDALAIMSQEWINLLVADLSIPQTRKDQATKDNGITLIKSLMSTHKRPLDIAVVTSYPEVIIRLKSDIEKYEGGGFTIALKDSVDDLLKKAEWALDGVIYTQNVPGMRSGDFRPGWFTLLQLAYEKGYEDKMIAKKMHVSPRTVRYYWSNIYDALGIYPEEGVNLRIVTEKKAREMGLIN